jgi:general secretion pathway protein A
MYLDFFGLKEYPFQLKPDPEFLFLSKGHAQAKSYLDFSILNRDGFVIITGEIGSGKTTLIQKLISDLDEKVVIAKISQTQLDEVEFLQAILVEFGQNPFAAKKVELLHMLNTYLAEQYKKGIRVLLIIDEAQNLSMRVLEEIRLLSGMELNKENLLNVILLGQPQLIPTLNSKELEQLVQRVRLRFHLKGMSKEEMRAYIEHRLKKAGLDYGGLFPVRHMSTLYEYTGGLPRLINILCDTILVGAYSNNVKKINIKIIRSALKELKWQPRIEYQKKPPQDNRKDRLDSSKIAVQTYQENKDNSFDSINTRVGMSFIDTINSLDLELAEEKDVKD